MILKRNLPWTRNTCFIRLWKNVLSFYHLTSFYLPSCSTSTICWWIKLFVAKASDPKILNPPFWKSEIRPPASLAIRAPAATSHGLSIKVCDEINRTFKKNLSGHIYIFLKHTPSFLSGLSCSIKVFIHVPDHSILPTPQYSSNN